jgi:hypothetical protein
MIYKMNNKHTDTRRARPVKSPLSPIPTKENTVKVTRALSGVDKLNIVRYSVHFDRGMLVEMIEVVKARVVGAIFKSDFSLDYTP